MTELEKLNESLNYIKSKSQLNPTIGIILGSGLSSFANHVKVDTEFSFSEIPHFPKPTVDGHPGKLILGSINSIPIVVLQGRVHYYEGKSPSEVAFPVRLLGLLKVNLVVLTNAAGGLDSKMKPGDFMIIEDHINLMGMNPLIGKNIDELGPRFPDMTKVYSRDHMTKLENVFKNLNMPYHKGVYCGLSGPTYETPAEIKYLKTIGVNAVGMSTVPEAIAARHMGVNVVGLSCITNLAAGMGDGLLNHEEVKDVGKKVETSFVEIIHNFMINI